MGSEKEKKILGLLLPTCFRLLFVIVAVLLKFCHSTGRVGTGTAYRFKHELCVVRQVRVDQGKMKKLVQVTGATFEVNPDTREHTLILG